MADGIDPRLRVIEALTESRQAILSQLESRLRAAGNPLVTDHELWGKCRIEADRAITDLVERIRDELRDGPRPDANSLVNRAAEAREARPIDAVQAGVELSDLVLGTFATHVESAPDRALFNAFQSLNQRIPTYLETVDRWQEASRHEQIRDTQDAERRRSAREIHDRIGNWISLAMRYLDLYEIYRERDPHTANEKIVDTRRVLGDLLESTRRLMSDLRLETPVRSAAMALRAFVRTVDPGFSVRVAVDGDEELIPVDLRDELFVVMREALRNVFAHAEATSASAVLQVTATQVSAVVEDDGAGFDLDVDLPSERRTGLDSMRERVELFGGKLVLASRPARGTRVEITVPLPESG